MKVCDTRTDTSTPLSTMSNCTSIGHTIRVPYGSGLRPSCKPVWPDIREPPRLHGGMKGKGYHNHAVGHPIERRSIKTTTHAIIANI